MNELLQQHGCSNVFTIPEGLKELMCDITREVLREQPENIFDFISNYLSVLIITREHGVLAMKILEDLCDCKATVSEHLMQLGIKQEQAEELAQVIKEEIEGFEPVDGKEKIKETQIVKKILNRSVLSEDLTARVCQIARNAYRDYWYRKKLLEKSMAVKPEEPWEIAAQHTLELYKRTKPSFGELTRATVKIQAAYRGYHVRRNLLGHLKPKPQKKSPKRDTFGPPVDIAASREIDLGPMTDVTIREDDVNALLNDYASKKLGLHYDPMKTITHIEDTDLLYENPSALPSSRMLGQSQMDAIGEDGRRFRKPSQLENPRQSRQISKDSITRAGIPSSASGYSPGHSIHKISFLEAPPEVIPDVFENEVGSNDMKSVLEAQEEPEVKIAEEAETEPAQEVPEDLDEQTEATSTTASVPSSAPITAENTDVEDTGEALDTTGEEAEE